MLYCVRSGVTLPSRLPTIAYHRLSCICEHNKSQSIAAYDYSTDTSPQHFIVSPAVAAAVRGSCENRGLFQLASGLLVQANVRWRRCRYTCAAETRISQSMWKTHSQLSCTKCAILRSLPKVASETQTVTTQRGLVAYVLYVTPVIIISLFLSESCPSLY